MEGFGIVAAFALVCSAFPGVAPAVARRFGMALLLGLAGVGSLLLFASYDRGVGAICWWGSLIAGFVLASLSEREDRREQARRREHEQLLAAIDSLGERLPP